MCFCVRVLVHCCETFVDLCLIVLNVVAVAAQQCTRSSQQVAKAYGSCDGGIVSAKIA